jgi:hypothetical protein
MFVRGIKTWLTSQSLAMNIYEYPKLRKRNNIYHLWDVSVLGRFCLYGGLVSPFLRGAAAVHAFHVLLEWWLLLARRRRLNVLPKRWYTARSSHDTVTQRIAIDSHSSVETSNHAPCPFAHLSTYHAMRCHKRDITRIVSGSLFSR